MAKSKKGIQADDLLRKQAEDQLSQLDSLAQQPLTIADQLKIFHELQVHQIELEMQNEELLAAQSNLEQYQAKYSNFFDFAPNSYFTLSPLGFILEVNLTGASLLGMYRSTLIGNSFAQFIYPEKIEIYNTYWKNLFKTRDHQVCELWISGYGGQKLMVRLDMSLVETETNIQVLIVITDINLPKKVEETQLFLLECSWAKAGRDFFEVLAEYLATSTNMNYVCIAKISENELEAETLASWFDGNYLENVKFKLQDTPHGEVVGKSVCNYLSKVRHQFPKDILLQKMAAESYVGITIWGTKGKPIGLISVTGRKRLVDSKLTEMVLKQVSIRAASEMEHRQVEKQLREREFFFRESQRAANIGSYMYDFTSEIWESSEVLDKILGIELSFVKSVQSWLDLVHPDDTEMVNQHLIADVIAQKKNFNKEYRIIRKSDNETRWIHVLGRPDFDLRGNIITLVGTIQDITERKIQQEALREKREQLESIFDNSQDLIYRYDIQNNNYVFLSPNLMKAYGYSSFQGLTVPEDMIMKSIHPDDSTRVDSELAQLNLSGRGILEFRWMDKDNQVLWLSATITVIYDANARPKYRDGIIRDITKNKQAEEALKNREEQLSKAFYSSPLGISLFRLQDGKCVLANKAFLSLVGYTEEEVIGHTADELDLGLSREETLYWMNALTADSSIENRKIKIHQKSGKTSFVLFSLTRIEMNGEVMGMLQTIDITGNEKSEELDNRYNTITKFARDPILMIDEEGNVIEANRAAIKYYGYAYDELLKLKIYDLRASKDRNITDIQMKKAFAEGILLETYHRHKDGSFSPVEVSSMGVIFNGKAVLLKVIRDITERKKTENALRESEDNMTAILNAATESIWLFDTDGKVLLGNKIGIKRIGMPAEDIIGIHFKKLISKELGDTRLKKLKEAAYTKLPVKLIDQRAGNYFEHTFYPVINSDGSVERVAAFSRDISQQLKEEQMQIMINRTLAALARSSQALLKSTNENSYLQEVCNIVREDCGFEMVWIGFAENNEFKSIRPVASAGFDKHSLELVKISWDNNEHGQGPTGTAIRTGKRIICTDMLNDPKLLPWRNEAIKRGYNSTIALPLTLNDKTIGAISIYSKEEDVFTEDEISLLSEVSNYLAHGITTIRLRIARELAEQELRRSKDNLEVLVDLRTHELLESNKSLNQEIDIRKKQEANLRAAEEKYRNVADFTSNWETWLAPDGKYIYVSPSCEAITGYTREEFMQDSTLFFRIAHADDRAFIENHYDEEIKNIHSQFSIDFKITTKEEQTVWIEHTCQPVFDSNGKWLGQRGSNRNITDRKLAESVLIESQKQLRALTQKVNEVAEEERIRIAREIHDELGHLLTAIKFDLESIRTNPELTSNELNTELESTIYMVEALIDTVRKISTELRPALLDHLGLLPAIDWLIMQFNSRTKITCVYKYKELNIEFDNKETTIIFRIVQEVLTNITRHSKATQVTISIGIVENNFELTITDNGIGFNMDEIYHSDSLGLMGMQERALSIGATLHIQSELKQGTTVMFKHRRK